jgi:hypothetical protein
VNKNSLSSVKAVGEHFHLGCRISLSFMPVLNEAYATQIARDWNAKDGGSGYVLRFQVDAKFLARYSVQTVGASIHREYWIPANELDEFNRHVVASIEVAASFQPSHGQARETDSK